MVGVAQEALHLGPGVRGQLGQEAPTPVRAHFPRDVGPFVRGQPRQDLGAPLYRQMLQQRPAPTKRRLVEDLDHAGNRQRFEHGRGIGEAEPVEDVHHVRRGQVNQPGGEDVRALLQLGPESPLDQPARYAHSLTSSRTGPMRPGEPTHVVAWMGEPPVHSTGPGDPAGPMGPDGTQSRLQAPQNASNLAQPTLRNPEGRRHTDPA